MSINYVGPYDHADNGKVAITTTPARIFVNNYTRVALHIKNLGTDDVLLANTEATCTDASAPFQLASGDTIDFTGENNCGSEFWARTLTTTADVRVGVAQDDL